MDKVLDGTSAVGELHFEPQYVIRDYVHVINDEEVRVQREKPLLLADAVPKILLNLFSYPTKKTPTQTCLNTRVIAEVHGKASGGVDHSATSQFRHEPPRQAGAVSPLPHSGLL